MSTEANPARFASAVFVLAMLSWPIALLPPPLSGHSYYLYLPARVLLVALSLVLLLRARFALPIWLKAAIAIFAIGLLAQFSHARWDGGAIAETLAYAVLPLAVAVCAAAGRPEGLTRWLAALWVLEIGYGILGYCYGGGETIGTTGNRNWLAILTLALIPWAFLRFRGCFGPLPALILVLVPSVWVLRRCESRGAWLALGIYLALLLILRIRGPRRYVLIAIVAICATLATPIVKQVAERDVRVPTWKAAIAMTMDAPLRGTGLGNYATAIVPYQLASGYHEAPDAADVTEHPHNEFLHLSASTGLPVAIAWLLLLIPLLRTPQDAPSWQRAAQYSGILILVHGMLDKPLVQAPTDVLFLAMLGLCWSPLVRLRTLRADVPRIPYLAGATILILLALAESARTVAVSWHKRTAIVLRHNYQDNHGALRAYQAMLSIDGNDLNALYGSGSILVNQIQDPERALDFLHAAREIAPDYAHLNGLTGRAYSALGMHSDALPYLQRECELYPMQIRRLQELWLSQVLAKDFQGLPTTQQSLRDLYRARAHMWGHNSDLVGDWEATQSIAAANRLCLMENKPAKSAANLRTVDPLIAHTQIPYERIHGGFDASDLAYWRLRDTRPDFREASDEAWFNLKLQSTRPIAYLRDGDTIIIWYQGRFFTPDGTDVEEPPDFADSATVIVPANALLLRNQILGCLTESDGLDWFPSSELARFKPQNMRFIEP